MKNRQFSIEDGTYETGDLGILGLKFLPNELDQDPKSGWTKILSNTGYIVGHFVTHGPSFSYGKQIGLHVGQVDQLTFISTEPKNIVGTFIDFRHDSSTFGIRAKIEYSTSVMRKLIVPCGVAHTFSGIENVVTRNDLIIHSSSENSLWKIEDDLVGFPIDTDPTEADAIHVNTSVLPQGAAKVFYQLQSNVMRGGRRLEPDQTDDGEQQSVEFDNKSTPPLRTNGEGNEPAKVSCEPNSFFPVAEESWGILPSTSSCEMDLFVVDELDENAPFRCHASHEILHTVLNHSGKSITIETRDMHQPGHPGRADNTFTYDSDERMRLVFKAGCAYRYRASEKLIIRQEVNEGLDDIPGSEAAASFETTLILP